MAIAPLRRTVLDEPEAGPLPGVPTPVPVRLAEPPPIGSSATPAAPVAPAGGGVRAWLRANTTALLLAACSLGGMVLLWHLATTHRVDFYVRFSNIPTPLEVLHSMLQAGSSGKFIANIGMSLRRIFLGFAVAVALGVTLGLLIGRYRLLRQLVFPALEALRPVPGIAWVPIWLGTSMRSN